MGRDVPLWRKQLCSALNLLADEPFQRENWFGRGKYVDSPDEQYNNLFTDYDIEEFVDSPEIGLNAQQRAAGHRLIDMLEAFDKVVGPELLPEVVIDHPQWVEIRHVARQFLDLLNCQD